MISWGYVYGGQDGKAGYRQNGVVTSAKDAQEEIAFKLSGQKVTFEKRDDKVRAYADGVPTGYIYFVVATESWAAIDKTSLGARGEKSLIAYGSLAQVKAKTRKYLEKQYGQYGAPETVTRVVYERTGDNFAVKAQTNVDVMPKDESIVLVRVS